MFKMAVSSGLSYMCLVMSVICSDFNPVELTSVQQKIKNTCWNCWHFSCYWAF